MHAIVPLLFVRSSHADLLLPLTVLFQPWWVTKQRPTYLLRDASLFKIFKAVCPISEAPMVKRNLRYQMSNSMTLFFGGYSFNDGSRKTCTRGPSASSLPIAKATIQTVPGSRTSCLLMYSPWKYFCLSCALRMQSCRQVSTR